MDSVLPVLAVFSDSQNIAGEFISELQNFEYQLVILTNTNAAEILSEPDSIFLAIVNVSELSRPTVISLLKNKYFPLIIIGESGLNKEIPEDFHREENLEFPCSKNRIRSRIKFYLRLYQDKINSQKLKIELDNRQYKYLELESKLKLLSSGANDPIVLLNHELKIVLWNNEAANFFGYNRYEIISENFLQWIVSPRSYKDFQKKIEEIIPIRNRKYTTEIVLTVQNKLKVECDVRLTISIHRNRQNRFHLVLVFQDLSKQRKLERELIKNRELWYENKLLREFVHHVTHELRTPLNSIMGVAKTLTKYNSGNLHPRQHEGLEIIYKSGALLVNLIKDLLDIARMDKNKLELNEELFETDKMLSLLKSQVLHLIGDKPVRFSVRRSPGIPDLIKADQRKLIQILTNLLGNSVKFTSQGKIVLSCHLFENKLFFEVSDTGIGIRPEKLKEIFLRFTQAENTFSSIGTGLGLTISKKLIQLMQGEISVESELGKGSNFRFYIALKEETSLPEHEVSFSSQDDFRLYNFKPSQQLLVVLDDRSDNWFTYSAVAEKFNLTLLLWRKGKAGLTAVKELLPDWVIVKIEIPEVHGLQILREISLAEPDMPVLAVTEIGDRLTGMPENIALIGEPVNPDQISDFIQKDILPRKTQIPVNICFTLQESRIQESLSSTNNFRFVTNKTPELSLLLLSRQKINKLIIENVSGNDDALQLALNILQDGIADKIGQIQFHYEGTLLKLLNERMRKFPNVKAVSKNELMELYI